jgi:hypothetical protein
LTRLANRLGRRANALSDDFVNRFAVRTEIKVIVRCGRHGTHASLGPKKKRAGAMAGPPRLPLAFGSNRRWRRRCFTLADVLCRGRDARERQRHCRQ